MPNHLYDVALSFAGEDRDYVKQVADTLRSNGVKVFYDEFERANLWGKELIAFLEDIYGNKSQYVMIFVSRSYLMKDWTNHELKSALNRAFKLREEYILPVMLDDTKLPGLHESIGYLSAKNTPPLNVSNIFLEKIGRKNVSPIVPALALYRLGRKKYINDLSGQAAALFGGTWNHKGIKVLYASSSAAGAVLEMIAHLPKDDLPADLGLIQIFVPPTLKIDTIYESDLPQNWEYSSGIDKLKQIGSDWTTRKETCILSVPSKILPIERTYLINPEHEKFSTLVVHQLLDFKFVPRI